MRGISPPGTPYACAGGCGTIRHGPVAAKAEGAEPVIPKTIEGTGLGRKTLEAISAEKGFSLDEVISRLRQNRIEAEPADRLKDIANKDNRAPIDIFGIIEGRE